jgi:PAS domain S-box-containing protein
VKTKAEKKIALEDLLHLPLYAQFLADQKLDELVKLHLRFIKTSDDLVHFYSGFDASQFEDFTRKEFTEVFHFLGRNDAKGALAKLLRTWETDYFPFHQDKEQRSGEMSGVTYLHKRTLSHFLPEYCHSTTDMLELVEEIDLFLLSFETKLSALYKDSRQPPSHDRTPFIEKVTMASPGIIYVYDLVERKEIFRNRSIMDLAGNKEDQPGTFSPDAMSLLIHPDDLDHVKQYEKNFESIKDGEVRSVKYRIRNNKNEYRWMRFFESSFKRGNDGKVLQKIGTAIDVHEQKFTADKLQRSDMLYRQAEALTHIGNYTWDMKTGEITWSDELYRIYGLDPSKDVISFENIEKFNDPSDTPLVRKATQTSIKENKPFDFHYRIRSADGKEKILHARGKITDESGTNDQVILGTVQDVTEKQMLIKSLRDSDNIYRQAAVLANMGNYILDLSTNEVSWTDQLYRIYGLEPQSEKMTLERFISFVHPRDKKMVRDTLDILLRDGQVDYSFQIMTDKGKVRTVRSIAKVERDEHGNPSRIIGIEQDITERQDLVQKLQRSEKMYRQAESMANMGNWTWDLLSNQLEWTDQLYRIYGLEPQSEEMTVDKFLAFVHPDDRNEVEIGVDKAFKEEQIDYTFRIILRDGTVKTLRSIAQIQKDEDGVPIFVVGTERDISEKERLINELRNRDHLYKQAQELTHIGNWSWNIAANKVEWSDELYRIFGFEPQSLPIDFELYSKLLHPEDRDHVIATIQNGMKNYTSYEMTHRILRNDGSVRVVQSYGEVMLDKNGNPAVLVGTAQDITENHNLLQELQQSKQLYEQAQQLSHIGNWSWEFETDKVEWSAELYNIYKLENGTAMNLEKVNSFIHPDDKERILAVLKQSVEKGTMYDAYHRIILHDGEVKTIHRRAEVIKDKNGKPVKLVGTTQDVSERQNLIERLQESEKLYKQAQLLSRMGNFAWDIHTNEVYWSEEVYHIYNIPAGTPVRFEAAFAPIVEKDKQKVQEAIEKTISLKKGQGVGYAIQLHDQEIKYVSLETDVILDNDKNVIRIIGTAQDITERQQLIERLQESEKQYKQAQSLSHIGNWTLDLESNQFSWSDEMYRIYGIDPSHKMNIEEWEHFIHPEDREATIAYSRECLKSKTSYDRLHRIVLKDGTVKTILRKGEFVFDESGKAVKMIGTTQDITKQHRIEQELKENQMFIRKITDATPSIIASYNINTGKYSFISEGIEKLLGYSVDEAMKQGVAFFSGIIHPEDAPGIMEKNTKALQEANETPEKNDMVIEFTYRMRHADGTYRWFHTYGTIFDRNKAGLVDHVLNISLDVTEQVKASQTIQEQEHFIQQIADASPTILYLYDVQNQSIVYINREIFFVLGFIPEEIIDAGEQLTEMLYHPDDHYLLPERHQSKKKFQQADSMMQYECRMKTKDGDWRWLLVREIAFKTDEHGQITQILGAALDINRRKEMEKTLLQNSFMLEQSNASLEEFAYVASHDLKEPLRKISTFGDRLIETEMEKMEPSGKLYLKKIVDASQRMQTMINDLLSISMISGNRSFESFPLQKVLDDTLQTLEYKIEKQNALILSDPLPSIDMIPSQFRQLFQNLLSNSLKFVREDVQPEIRIRYELLDKEQGANYQIKEREQYHKIQISDNGIGFENEFAGKIFAIFQRLHGRSEYEGSGIGLAICKKIVEHHGGIIFANGAPGQGSTFTIILPI